MPRVGAFNIEYGATGYPAQRAVDLIRKSGADVVVLLEALSEDQKVDGSATIADGLGWHRAYIPYNQSAVVSKWPLQLVDAAAGVVQVTAPSGAFHVVSVHPTDFSYQPFQAENIPYCVDGTCQRALKTATALVRSAETTRGKVVSAAASAAARYLKKGPVVVAGDFNEPSHLDWTARAVAAGLHPVAVPYPASKKLHGVGLADAYRRAYPDEVKHPGNTWPTAHPGYEHRPDRIDFIYVGDKDRVKSFDILDSPSDHKMVVADVEFATPPLSLQPSETPPSKTPLLLQPSKTRARFVTKGGDAENYVRNSDRTSLEGGPVICAVLVARIIALIVLIVIISIRVGRWLRDLWTAPRSNYFTRSV